MLLRHKHKQILKTCVEINKQNIFFSLSTFKCLFMYLFYILVENAEFVYFSFIIDQKPTEIRFCAKNFLLSYVCVCELSGFRHEGNQRRKKNEEFFNSNHNGIMNTRNWANNEKIVKKPKPVRHNQLCPDGKWIYSYFHFIPSSKVVKLLVSHTWGL